LLGKQHRNGHGNVPTTEINTGSQSLYLAATSSSTYVDVDGDRFVTASDVLSVINYLNGHPGGDGSTDGPEGESVDAALVQEGYSPSDVLQEDVLTILATELLTSKPRSNLL
jgi:hypothetical protein